MPRRPRLPGALLDNLFGTRLSPMSRERSDSHLSGMDKTESGGRGGETSKARRSSVEGAAGEQPVRPERDQRVRQKVATPAGLEPATSSLEGSRSIQLSYGAELTFVRFVTWCANGPKKTSLNSLSYDFPVALARIEGNSSNSDVLRRPSRDDAHQTDAGPRYGKALANARKRRP